MTAPADNRNRDRIIDLLVQRASEGLNAQEQIELDRLLAQHPRPDSDEFERIAAALVLAAAAEAQPLPPELQTRLYAQADAFAAGASVTAIGTGRVRRPVTVTSNRFAWFAAAASIVLAVVGWWPRLQEQPQIDALSQASLDLPTLAQRREELLAKPAVVRRDWQTTADPAATGVSGDVIWDPQTQNGYMRFSGLPVNDPQRLQYQLWIFDATRGDQYPVDGGVFNVPAGGEVVVPIIAKLPVRGEPALFAVTIEKPGGVVVSARERIVVIAPAPAAG